MEEPAGIQAIQTVYDNHKFRSRLEARWAVFFNSLSIPYQYEAEGFRLGSVLYLPDFWLPSLDFFFEVKGPFTDNNGDEKARRLAEASGRMVYLFGPIPKIDELRGFDDTETGKAYFPHGYVDDNYLWCRKSCCGKYGIQYKGRSERIPCDCGVIDRAKPTITYNNFALLLAYTAARHHRFERGGA